MNDQTAPQRLFCTSLQIILEFIYSSISQSYMPLLLLTWRFIFTGQTNCPLLSNHSPIIYRTSLCLPFFFSWEVGVDVLEARQTAEVLEAETKFTSPCCHRCGSTSSVVMATLVMREGLLTGPEGQPRFPRAGVRQTTLRK